MHTAIYYNYTYIPVKFNIGCLSTGDDIADGETALDQVLP